jgi:hypothetical protein
MVWTEPTAPWEVLNVRPGASPKEVRAAFLDIGAAPLLSIAAPRAVRVSVVVFPAVVAPAPEPAWLVDGMCVPLAP